MPKEVTTQKAYKAMKTIMRYCEQQKVCSGKCKFYRNTLIHRCCISLFQAPAQWDIDTVKEKMEAEKCGNQS